MHTGDRIPDLTVTIQTHEQCALRDLLGTRATVLYFYPKDDTPVCTKEACSFRDAYEDFFEAGATVVGVSSDDVASHQAFAARHRLPFTLVADVDGALRNAFQVPKLAGFFDGRTTYVIDQHGVIRHRFTSHFTAENHIEEALSVVRTLLAEG